MRNFIFAVAGLASLAAPLAAQTYPGELRDDRREIRQDRQELRDDRRNGDVREFREDRRELREDQREFREDRRDFRDDRRDGYTNGYRDNYRNNYRDSRRYDAGRYYHPRGYAYRSWGVGAFLPRAYWGGSYIIGRPSLYGLGYARPRSHWVRVGPDALLIRSRDGAVIQVIRGRFY